MLSRIKLGQKALLLVGLPLAFELGFAVVMFSLMHDAEQDVLLTNRTQKVVSQINKIFIDVFEVAVEAKSTTSGSMQLAETAELIKHLREEILDLKDLCSDIPAHVKRVQGVLDSMDRLLDDLGEPSAKMKDTGDWVSDKEKARSMRPAFRDIAVELQAIRKDHEKLELKRLDDESKRRKQIMNVLLVGSIINVILALGLVSLFNRNIIRRLNNLMANTYLLSIGKPLNPPVAGSDEIAHLDRTFNKVAGDLLRVMNKQQAIFQDVVDVICSVAEDGSFTEVSKSASKAWGYDQNELVGTNLFDLVVADEAKMVKAKFQELRETKGKTQIECRLRKSNGPIINVLWSVSWSETEKSFFCVAHDITERKHNEDLLIETEATLRTIVENLPIGLIMTNLAGTVKMLNPAAQAMFGLKHEEAFDRKIDKLLELGSTLDITKESMDSLIGTNTEVRAHRFSGETFPAEIAASSIRTAEGRQIIFLVVDVTERHEVERMKRQFVAMVSHELRTPLTSVKNYLELMERGTYGTLNDRGRETLGRVEENLNRLTGLIEDLLDIEKLESGSMTLEMSQVELEDVLDLAMESVRAAAAKKDIEVVMPPTELVIKADRDKLVQVLTNLLANAIKFSDACKKVEVKIENSDVSVKVIVIDEGRGIPLAARKKIFERFQQIEQEDSRRYGGAGLGLAICKEIVTLHGGTIGVESTEGKGSRFWFEIAR
ncbi:MAG: PAS domain S-box protein [Candidatus Melainabacteria bacterium]|nr:PAS domain S-box protein [Candidatus Melainabacteria bacterium]